MFHYCTNQLCNPLCFGISQNLHHILRQFFFLQDPSSNRILDIMIDIRNAVSHTNYIALFCIRHTIGMTENAVPHFICQVQPFSMFFNQVNYPKALLIMTISMGTDPVENRLSAVSKRGVSQIMPQRNCLCQIFI